jgi:tetratricopeptide (TPR) repeat protein
MPAVNMPFPLLISFLALSIESWIVVIIGVSASFLIAYFIYFKQKKEAGEHLQKHESRFDELKHLHEQDSEKIRVLYELILRSQSGSIGESESAALEKQIEAAADNITEQDSDQAQALKAIADKDKEKADDLLVRISQKEHELEELYDLHAINEHRHGNYPAAVPWLQKLVELKPDNMNYKERLYVDMSNSGYSEQAEKLSRQVLHELESQPDADPEGMVRWLRNMAAEYANMVMPAEAEATLTRALEYGTKILGADHHMLYAVYNDLGCICLSRNEFVQAEQYFRTALRIHKIEDEDDRIHEAYVICNIGTALKGQERYEEAVKLYQEGVREMIEKFGDDHPVLTFYYGHLGGLAYKQKDFVTAKDMFLKALAIFEHKQMYSNPAMSSTLTMLGHISLAEKDFAAAEQFYMRSIQQQEQNPHCSRIYLLHAYHYLGEAYLENEDFTKAEPWLEKTIASYCELPEPDKNALQKAYNQLADVKTRLGKIPEAEAAKAEAAKLQ